MPLAINKDFQMADAIKYDFESNLLGGEANWAGIGADDFNIPASLLSIPWDSIGLSTATLIEYSSISQDLYCSDPAENFIDNLALFNAWVMVNVYPPKNLTDTEYRTDLPLSFIGLAKYALQHVKDPLDVEDEQELLDYHINVFWYEGSSQSELNLNQPKFSKVQNEGFDFFKNVKSYRYLRDLDPNSPTCNFSTGTDYCKYKTPGEDRFIVPQYVPYQLTYGYSPRWAPQDLYGRTKHQWLIMAPEFVINYDPFSEIEEEAASSSSCSSGGSSSCSSSQEQALLSSSSCSSSIIEEEGLGLAAVDFDDLWNTIFGGGGSGYDNRSGQSFYTIYPLPQLEFSLSGGHAISVGDSTKFGLYIPDHRITLGSSVTIRGTDNYNGTYVVSDAPSANMIILRRTFVSETFGTDAMLTLLDATAWLYSNPKKYTIFRTAFEDITLDVCGIDNRAASSSSAEEVSSSSLSSSSSALSSSCEIPSSSAGPYEFCPGLNVFGNYYYKIYIDEVIREFTCPTDSEEGSSSSSSSGCVYAISQLEGFPTYRQINLFKNATMLDLAEFGGYDRYFTDSWIRLDEQLDYYADYFGHRDVTIPESIIRRIDGYLTGSAQSAGDGLTRLEIKLENTVQHSFRVDDIVTIENTDSYDGKHTITAVSATAIIIDTDYTPETFDEDADTIKLNAPYTFAGDLYNGTALMIDTVNRALQYEEDKRLQQTETIVRYGNTGYFDIVQRMEEALGEIETNMERAFAGFEERIAEEVELSESSLVSISDILNVNEGSSSSAGPETSTLENNFADPDPDLSPITLDSPHGVIKNAYYDIIPKAAGNINTLIDAYNSEFWTVRLIGPMIKVNPQSVKITREAPTLGQSYSNLASTGKLAVKYNIIPTVKNTELALTPTVEEYTDETKQPYFTIADNKITTGSFYQRLHTIEAIPNYNVTVTYDQPVPTPYIYGDSNITNTVSFDFGLEALNFKTGLDLDFDNKIVFKLYTHYKGKYRDVTSALSDDLSFWDEQDRTTEGVTYSGANGSNRYRWTSTDKRLQGDITFDPEDIPSDFFDEAAEDQGVLIKTIDIVLFYLDEGDAELMPICLLPAFMYKIQYQADVVLKYNSDNSFRDIMEDNNVDNPYYIVLGDREGLISGYVEVNLTDFIGATGNRLLTIGQALDMFDGDIGLAHIYNGSVGPYEMTYSAGTAQFSQAAIEQIISDYQSGTLQYRHLFNVNYEGVIIPFYVYRQIPATADADTIDIEDYVAPELGNTYRSIREWNGSQPLAQTSGLYSHINRFQNPHRVSGTEGTYLIYE